MNYTIINLSTGQELTMFGDSPEQALSNAHEYVIGNANTWTWKARYEVNRQAIVRGKAGMHLGDLSLSLRHNQVH